MSSNIYMQFANDYLKFLLDAKKKNPNKRFTSVSGYAHGNKYSTSSEVDQLKLSFDYIVSKLDTPIDANDSQSISDWLRMVQFFAEFIRLSEKCFFYNNSDEATIYADHNNKESILYCILNNMNSKIRISFEKSSISMPDKNSSLLGFLNDEDDNQSMVEFIQIDIDREFGKQMKNQFRFIIGSAIPYKDDTDELLIQNITRIISQMIFDCFIDIIDNYVTIISGIDYEELKVKEVLNHGLWIRRR